MTTASLFERLRAAAAVEWRAYTSHPFIQGIAAGTLPQACFTHYLTQDYLFLVQFARAYGLAAFKGETLADIRAAAATLTAIVETELPMHLAYCREWGLCEPDLEATREAKETLAYTRFVLDRGLAGDLLDLLVALAPCVVGYGEIGRALAADPATRRTGNPYGAWIATYAGDEYQRVAAAHAAQMNALAGQRETAGRWPSLLASFRTGTRLETDFWSMGLNPPPLA